MRVCVYVCVCACVFEKERKRERERETEAKDGIDKEKKKLFSKFMLLKCAALYLKSVPAQVEVFAAKSVRNRRRQSCSFGRNKTKMSNFASKNF